MLEWDNSYIYHTGVRAVQGSICGPMLYALCVSPIFDIAMLTMFADDNYVICYNKHLVQLITDMKHTLELIIKWLKESGLKVNDEKTELYLFYKNDMLYSMFGFKYADGHFTNFL